jgi:PadR family transcriptional regulator, regulatory protein PadR
MGSMPRYSHQAALILAVFLRYPDTEQYGLGLCDQTYLKTGTIFPILQRFEGLGWLKSRLEPGRSRDLGHPPRVYYQLTAKGRQSAPQYLALRRNGPRP